MHVPGALHSPGDEIVGLRDSLSVALARIEASRLREKRLLEENHLLRKKLEALSSPNDHSRLSDENRAVPRQSTPFETLSDAKNTSDAPRMPPVESNQRSSHQEEEWSRHITWDGFSHRHPVRMLHTDGSTSPGLVVLNDT